MAFSNNSLDLEIASYLEKVESKEREKFKEVSLEKDESSSFKTKQKSQIEKFNDEQGVLKKHQTKLLSTFVVLCAAVTVAEPELVNIPVFNNLFLAGESESVITYSDCKISEVSANINQVDVNLIFDKEDGELQSDFYLYLVREEDATEKFFANVADKVKENLRLKVDHKTITYRFTRCMTQLGENVVKPETNYAVLLVRDNQIVQTSFVTTKKFTFITEVKLETKTDYDYRNHWFEKHLMIKISVNEEFDDFDKIIYELTNKETGEKFVTEIRKEDLSIAFADYYNNEYYPVYDYSLKLYCETENLELIDTSKYTYRNGTKIYLIYTHSENIRI